MQTLHRHNTIFFIWQVNHQKGAFKTMPSSKRKNAGLGRPSSDQEVSGQILGLKQTTWLHSWTTSGTIQPWISFQTTVCELYIHVYMSLCTVFLFQGHFLDIIDHVNQGVYQALKCQSFYTFATFLAFSKSFYMLRSNLGKNMDFLL